MTSNPKSNRPVRTEAQPFGQRGELLVLIQAIVFFSFLLVPAWNPWLVLPGVEATALIRLGFLATCFLIAMILAGMGMLNLGENLTPLPFPRNDNKLVTSGIYAVVRHPLYASQLFAALGWVAYSLSLSHLLILIGGFIFFDYKATREEAWLSKRHPEYASYAQRVKKMIPWVY